MQHLNREELLRLLKTAREHSERDWLLLLVTFSHGLRATEAVQLTKANFKDGHITVRRLKGSLKTTQALLSNAEPLLDEKTAVEEYTATLAPKEKLFPVTRFGFSYIVKRHCRTAGIPAHKAHCHALKHSVAMMNVRGAGIENIRQWLGHKSIASTGEYLRCSDEEAGNAVAKSMAGAAL